MKVLKIACVCKGNTCRSPMIEALTRLALEERGIAGKVESFGVIPDILGQGYLTSAHEHSVAIMAERGIDITSHVPRHVSNVGDLAGFDLIMAAEPFVYDELLKLGAPKDRTILFNVTNPWQRGRQAYLDTLAEIDAGLPAVIEKLT